jgi:superfamily II DNA or RNA helicase
VLIVAPGSLVDQWRDELFEKFGLEFRGFPAALEAESPGGNPFEDHHQIIVRLDQMSRNEELQIKLCAAEWDLVVFDNELCARLCDRGGCLRCQDRQRV